MTFAEAAGQLNAALERAADVFAEMDINVRAAVPMSVGRLAFGKLPGGAWNLIYVAHDGTEGPVTSASIRLRIEAATKLDELKAALLAANRATIADAIGAARAVEAFAKTHGK